MYAAKTEPGNTYMKPQIGHSNVVFMESTFCLLLITFFVTWQLIFGCKIAKMIQQ
jgi:hypothetical protein